MRKWWAAAGLVAGGAALYATVVEPRWLDVRRPTIHIRGLPAALEGLTIGLLTDLHAGGLTPYSLIQRAVTHVMRHQPDLIALTGDLASDRAPDFRDVLDALDRLHAPLGVYAVPGNHDHIVGIDAWRRGVARHPTIRDLTNRYEMIDVGAARLCVAGVDDYYRGDPELVLPPVRSRDLTVLLAHGPDQAERSRRWTDSVDLILSGHTHAGQVRVPGVGAPLNSADRDDLYEHGVRRRPWTQVYISRGVGTVHVPVRFLARPEVAVLTLTGAPRPRRPLDRSRDFRRWSSDDWTDTGTR